MPVPPDLTVALTNPIKYFSAHDKKSVKLKEATGSLPEVCMARIPARNFQEFCPPVWVGGWGVQGTLQGHTYNEP
jgi:phosphatidylinositol phospholipase C beta